MDPITQALTGAVAAQATTTKWLGRSAALIGAVGGELADVDVFFGPWSDPALPFELHRHFTHSLAVIPLGGLLATLPFMLFKRFRDKAGAVLAAATIGFATHALLDNCTSYGTHLLWPFVSYRTAWDSMSIIDPIYTGILFITMIVSFVRGLAGPARAGFVLAMLYIGLGFYQHHRAAEAQEELAASRGHEIERGRVSPTLANIVLFRSVYEYDGRLYADAIRVPVGGPPRVREGESRRRFTVDDLPTASTDPDRVRRVFEAFDEFATGMTAEIAVSPPGSIVLGDMRYSLDTAGFQPLWGLQITPSELIDPVASVGFQAERPEAMRSMVSEILGQSDGYVSLAEISGR